MAKTEIETVELKKKIAKIVDIYGEASKAKKTAEETMEKNRPAILETAIDVISADAKSVNLEGAQYTAQVSFKDQMSLNVEAPEFKKLAKYIDAGKVPAIATQRAVCIAPEKTEEAVQILRSIGREDLIVNTIAYGLVREVYEAQAANDLKGESATIQDLVNACVVHKSIPSIKIK